MRRREGRSDRRHRRYDVDGITGSLQFTTPVTIVNISAGGMQVRTRSHLGVGRRYTIKLVRGERTTTLVGRIAWCVLAGSTRVDEREVAPNFIAGIAFEQSLTDLGSDLLELIDESVVLQLDRPLAGQVAVEDAPAASALAEHPYRVIRISRSGMLVVTDLVPELNEMLNLEIGLGDFALRTQGRVAFVKQREAEGLEAEVGIEFTEIDAAQRAALSRFIEREFAQEDPQLAGSAEGEPI